MLYFKVPGITSPIQIEKPAFSDPELSNLPQRLASILFDDLKDGEGNDVLANFRINIAAQYIYKGADKGLIGIWADPTNKTVTLKLHTGEVGDMRNKDAAKELLINYLTKLGPTRRLTPEQIGDRKKVDINQPETFKNNYVTKVGEDWFMIEPMKLQIDKGLINKGDSGFYDDFNIENGILKTKKETTRHPPK